MEPWGWEFRLSRVRRNRFRFRASGNPDKTESEPNEPSTASQQNETPLPNRINPCRSILLTLALCATAAAASVISTHSLLSLQTKPLPHMQTSSSPVILDHPLPNHALPNHPLPNQPLRKQPLHKQPLHHYTTSRDSSTVNITSEGDLALESQGETENGVISFLRMLVRKALQGIPKNEREITNAAMPHGDDNNNAISADSQTRRSLQTEQLKKETPSTSSNSIPKKETPGANILNVQTKRGSSPAEIDPKERSLSDSKGKSLIDPKGTTLTDSKGTTLSDPKRPTRSDSRSARTGSAKGEVDKWHLLPNEKFMWYSAHSGFGNQVVELKWGMRIAGYLNRTLILPPKLPHQSPVPSIGRCDRYPNRQARLRHAAWNVYTQLLRSKAYVSIADVLDIASVPSSLVSTIDLRHFVIAYCGCDVSPSCTGPVCQQLHNLNSIKPTTDRKARECLTECGYRLGAQERHSLPWESSGHLSRVEYHCQDSVYTVGVYSRIQDVVSAVGPGQLQLLHPSVYVASDKKKPFPRAVNLDWAFGPKTKAGKAKVLAFGSCFHPRIADLHLSKSATLRRLFDVTFSIPLSAPIMALARSFVYKNIKDEFACMHIRGGDGFFRTLLASTLKSAEDQLQRIVERHKEKESQSQLVAAANASKTAPRRKKKDMALFLMTDLPWRSFRKSFLPQLGSWGVRLITSSPIRSQIARVGRALRAAEWGFCANRVEIPGMDILQGASAPSANNSLVCEDRLQEWLASQENNGKSRKQFVGLGEPADMALFVEQATCCYYDLGIVYTYRSTASGLVQAIKQGGHCNLQSQCFNK